LGQKAVFAWLAPNSEAVALGVPVRVKKLHRYACAIVLRTNSKTTGPEPLCWVWQGVFGAYPCASAAGDKIVWIVAARNAVGKKEPSACPTEYLLKTLPYRAREHISLYVAIPKVYDVDFLGIGGRQVLKNGS
jgi:hypothetical protein